MKVPAPQPDEIPVLDLHPPAADFHAECVAGLSGRPKRLPCKFFYDRAGSAIFEEICELPEYYPTRTEVAILRSCGDEIGDLIGSDPDVIELGSGSTRKARILLDHLNRPAAYVPVEISRSALLKAAGEFRRSHPGLPVLPVCADYTRRLRLPPGLRRGGRTLIFFPGSTIGNFEPTEAGAFLARLTGMVHGPGLMLIGVDLRKDPQILEAAYNDSGGVTARFNKNMLARANRELSARFDLESFEHRANYDRDHGRIEMHLASRQDQVVGVNGCRIRFEAGETISTEYSYKYSIEGFRSLARAAGYEPLRAWTDPDRLFSVHLLAFGGIG